MLAISTGRRDSPWGGFTRDACRRYSYDEFDRAKTTEVRQDALGALPRCLDLADPGKELLAPNDLKRYDPLGRNIRARHDTLNLAGTTISTETVNLHHVGLDQTVAYEQTVGAPQRSGRYVNTPGGTPLAVSDANGTYQFLHRDGQGDTVAAITPAGGVACAPEIDQWGESDNDPCMDPLSVDSPNRKWYNSSRLDAATGTYQWGDRTYNPTTATWQQPDTPAMSGAPTQVSIGTDPLVANRYSYVNSDPINHNDPTGHRLCEGSWDCDGRSMNPAAAAARHEAVESLAADPDDLLDFLQNDEGGQMIFSLIDACGQGLDAVDGNWSREDVACGANRLGIVELLNQAGVPGQDRAALLEMTLFIADVMARTDEAWETIDYEASFLERNSVFRIQLSTIVDYASTGLAVASFFGCVACAVGSAVLTTVSAVDTCVTCGVGTNDCG